jgi:hypothetical protein
VTKISRSFCLLLTLAFSPGCLAGQWGDFWDAMAQRPDATVTDGPDIINGGEERRIALKSGVEFILQRQDGQVTAAGLDKTGQGAVLCTWQMFIGTKIYLDTCSPKREPDLEADLDSAIDQINDFIVENSIQPTSKDELLKAIEQRRKEFAPVGDGKKCPTLAPLAIALKALSRADRQAIVTKTLSIKRPPVLNPCL